MRVSKKFPKENARSLLQQKPRKWRRRWDSNPRALSDNAISSRARYDRFDTSPGVFQLLTKLKVQSAKNEAVQIFGNFLWKQLKTILFSFYTNPAIMRVTAV